jgi:hypothetical protein
VRRTITFFAGVATLTLSSVVSARGRYCTEQSDVVGEERCSTFGDSWSVERRPAFTSSIDVRFASFDPNGLTFTYKKNRRPPFSGSALSVLSLDSYGLGFGFMYTIAESLYLQNDYGFTANSATLPSGERDVLFMSDMTAGPGLRARVRHISLRLEADLGFTVAAIGKASAARGVVRPTGGIDVWLSPYATIGAFGGVNVLAWRERIFGVVLTYHARSLDGAAGGW